MPQNKKEAFHREMLLIFDKAKKECNYKPVRFLNMVANLGGVEAAKILVNSKEYSDGFTILWEAKKLGLTVEALVIQDEWKDLFSDEDIRKATKRLMDCGYFK